jgi:hypothetical protein
MAKTVDTSAATLCPVLAFLDRVDHRTVGDLASDDGERIPAGSLPSHPTVLACLLDASGQVEQACQVGKRYSPADLAALTGVGRAGLYRLVTRLAMLLLFERRPDRELKVPEVVRQALDDLQKLRDGELLFPFVEAQDAGLPTAEIETAEQVEARGGIVQASSRLFGRRNNRVDPWGGGE